MGKTFVSLFSLLLATAIVLTGHGLQGTLIPIRGDIEAFSGTIIGLIGTAYYIGFILGCLHCPVIVQRSGHIRAFAAFASLASVTPLIHALIPSEIVWIFFRVVTGYCFCGLFMIIESWINEEASSEMRGRVFSIYLAVNLISITVGQLLINLASPGSMILFVLASILASFALLPVALSNSSQPKPIQRVKLDLRRLWQTSSIGLVGCFVVGLTNGPFWTLAPVFAREIGMDVRAISFFMTAAIFGGAVAQWPIGRLSDVIDRRKVIIFVSLGAVIGEVWLVSVAEILSQTGLLLVTFCFGAFSLTLYPVCIAQANDHTKEGDFVSVSGGLLLSFSIGAIIGPAIASIAMISLGTGVIFIFSAAFHTIYAFYVLSQLTLHRMVPPEERSGFVVVPVSRIAPETFELDPRAEIKKEP
ncbi:MAG: MFS transporter [SAR324 cluster bacterium]|nr:MFS transporter [SAR324 cluster bacterium]